MNICYDTDTSLHPLPWEGAHKWKAAGLVQGWLSAGQEWGPQRVGCHRLDPSGVLPGPSDSQAQGEAPLDA